MKETTNFTNLLENLSIRAVGRRKEAVAKVQIINGTGQMVINNKTAQDYLQNNSCSILAIKAPFEVLQTLDGPFKYDQIDTIIKVEGGGLIGQAEAIKLAVARAIFQLGQIICSSNESNEEGNLQKNMPSSDSEGFSGTEGVKEIQLSETLIKKSLKSKGLLTVDARVKERRKYGLKKARKASQYHKR